MYLLMVAAMIASLVAGADLAPRHAAEGQAQGQARADLAAGLLVPRCANGSTATRGEGGGFCCPAPGGFAP